MKNSLNKKYEPFWVYFKKNEKKFHSAVKNQKNEERIFEKLSTKLSEQLGVDIEYLAGMADENTVLLSFSAGGVLKNTVVIEEFVNSAPDIPGWKFTSSIPDIDMKDFRLEMFDHKVDRETLSFYSNDSPEYPDLIDITFVHSDLNDENISTITHGTYIFLQSYLGEIFFITTIDKLNVIGKKHKKKEQIPLDKLKAFLTWKEKEFIEKYDATRYDTQNDMNSVVAGSLENGRPLIATINSTLLEWDGKASHPWILSVQINYDGEANNGLPDDPTYKLLDNIEDKVKEELKDIDGYLNIGRQTADGSRNIYFACKDFRRPSRVLHQLRKKHLHEDKIDICFDIYKDKYWQSFDHFRHHL